MIVLHALVGRSIWQLFGNLFPIAKPVLLNVLQKKQLFLVRPKGFIVKDRKANRGLYDCFIFILNSGK